MSSTPKAYRKKPASDGVDFSSLVASKPRKEIPTFQIDMSRFWPEKAEALKQKAEEAGEPWEGLLFTYRPFRMNQMFELQELMIFVKRQRPLWAHTKCIEVATLVACHVDPPARKGASPEENRTMLVPLYCQTFEDADDDDLTLFLFLEEFNTKSGNFLKNLQGMIEERKKNSEATKAGTPSELSESVSNT